MLSKWQIWDFFSSFNKEHLKNFEGVLAINTFDPLSLKFVKDFMIRGAGMRVIHYKVASEISKSWLEEEFQALSLFGNTESFFIHHAQDLKLDLLDVISNLKLDGRFIILSFENEAASWKKILKEDKVETLMLEAPRFWELNKLLDFVCILIRLPLSFEAKSWILESLENDLGTFYNSCCLIKLNYPDARSVEVEQVKELLTIEKLDQFAMASSFARKKTVEFFEKLIALEGDFEKMRAFFNFLQSHLVKMADTSYLAKKPRLTQYDKDLQGTAKLWKNSELTAEIERFNRWEIMCKRKDSHLWHEMKVFYLRAL